MKSLRRVYALHNIKINLIRSNMTKNEKKQTAVILFCAPLYGYTVAVHSIPLTG